MADDGFSVFTRDPITNKVFKTYIVRWDGHFKAPEFIPINVTSVTPIRHETSGAVRGYWVEFVYLAGPLTAKSGGIDSKSVFRGDEAQAISISSTERKRLQEMAKDAIDSAKGLRKLLLMPALKRTEDAIDETDTPDMDLAEAAQEQADNLLRTFQADFSNDLGEGSDE